MSRILSFPVSHLASLPVSTPALARDNGQYNQVSPEVRQWFREQKSPKDGTDLCNEADGSEAQEDIRDGHYWTTSPAVLSTGDQVPDEVVIKDPNKVGHPIVWILLRTGQRQDTLLRARRRGMRYAQPLPVFSVGPARR